MKKRLLSALLALCMVLMMLPTAFAADTDDFVIENGVLIKYTGSGGEVVIPNGVTAIGDEAFRLRTNITSVVISSTVTHIGNWAFQKCTNLTDVIIPDSVSSIGNCAFAECTNLTSITIPDSVTSIGSLAFIRTNLISITLPKNIVELGQYVFQGCSALTSITFPEKCQTAETLKNWTRRDFGDLFKGCNALTEVNNIPSPEYTEYLSANQAFFSAWINPGRYVTVQNGPRTYLPNAQDERIIAASNQITAGLTSDYEKAKAIASWVSENIVYDGRTGGSFTFAQAPTVVLESKRAVCEGYTALTRALLQAAGIPALCISGYGDGFIGGNHAWNMAFVDGRWIFIDATWGEFDSNIYNFSGSHKTDFNNLSYFVFSSAVNTPTDWAQNEVWDAICTGLVPNDLQAAYRDNITREEFCCLMVSLVEKSTVMDIESYLKSKNLTSSNPFIDTDNAAVLAAYTLGVVKGTSETTFNPDGSITRQEAATLLARTAKVLGLTAEESENFNDAELFASWASESIAFVSGLTDPTTGGKVMNGTGNGNFSPTNN